MSRSFVPIAVRAYTERTDQPHRGGSTRRWGGWPEDVLVLDTETTTDAIQRLTFGSWQQWRWQPDKTLACVAEGLFYDDDLPTRDPDGMRALRRYVRTHRAIVDPAYNADLALMSRRDFLRRVFHPLAYTARATVVGFNLPFDLTRLVSSWGEGRNMEHPDRSVPGGKRQNRWYGGFSCVLWDWQDRRTGAVHAARTMPRLSIKAIDSKRAFIRFMPPKKLDHRDADVSIGSDEKQHFSVFPGHFLDLRTLAFALTSEAYSLDRACEEFTTAHRKIQDVHHGLITARYIDYNRRDVLATSELLVALRREFDTHPIGLDPCKAYSPASIAKGYMHAMGVTPPFRKFGDLPLELAGIAMASYYGGRAEARIRKVPVPVVHTDFVSMYPTVNALMHLWGVLTAESLRMEPWGEDAQRLLDTATADRYFDQAAWHDLVWFAEIVPEDDMLPVRAQYDAASDGYNIAVSRLTTKQRLWYAGPDLVASAILTGRAPRVLRAIRLVPVGLQAGLKPVQFAGTITVDPVHDDLYVKLVEERKRGAPAAEGAQSTQKRIAQALKIVANSGSYGTNAEIHCDDNPKDTKVKVRVFSMGGSFEVATTAPESPGEYCFPPLAALITAGARLMLALLEHAVTSRGGTYAFCDTDSMAIVATKRGGLVRCEGGTLNTRSGEAAIRALSWGQVDEIAARFTALNPYNRAAVPGSILEVKDVNFDARKQQRAVSIYVIAAKRYTFFRLGRNGRLAIIDPSEHGLGHLLNPLGKAHQSLEWVGPLWEGIVAKALGLPRPTLSFLDRPALTRISVSSPHVLSAFTKANADLPVSERVRPFNFLLSATMSPYGHPVGVDPTDFHLVHRFEDDPVAALRTEWTDLRHGGHYQVTTEDEAPPEVARIKSYRDVLAAYLVHPEPKSADQRGQPCGKTTHGLLYRRRIGIASFVLHGKEANRIEDVQNGLVHHWDDVCTKYLDPTFDPWRTDLLPKLRALPRPLLAEAAGISPRAVRAILNEHGLPSDRTRAAFLDALEAAGDDARPTRPQKRSTPSAHKGRRPAAPRRTAVRRKHKRRRS